MLRVFIADDFMGLAVRISIVREFTDHSQISGPVGERQILRLGQDDTVGQTCTWEQVPSDGGVIEPTIVLGEDEARALLDGLSRHFEGAEDTRALRRDYDHERQRVDQLVGSLAQIAGSLAVP